MKLLDQSKIRRPSKALKVIRFSLWGQEVLIKAAGEGEAIHLHSELFPAAHSPLYLQIFIVVFGGKLLTKQNSVGILEKNVPRAKTDGM